jgi:hypothetical protein
MYVFTHAAYPQSVIAQRGKAHWGGEQSPAAIPWNEAESLAADRSRSRPGLAGTDPVPRAVYRSNAKSPLEESNSHAAEGNVGVRLRAADSRRQLR